MAAAESSSESEQEDGLSSLENSNTLVEKTERDLQLIFKKLRVNNERKRSKRTLKLKCLRRDEHHGRLNKTYTERRVLKEATFVYKSCTTKLSKLSKLTYDSEKSECELNGAIPISKIPDSNTSSSKQGQRRSESKSPDLSELSCSGQFRRAQCSSMPKSRDVNFDDTTPEELAAYFEQLLHIPKPMSAMAEMMYT